jgi:hypothetical protein
MCEPESIRVHADLWIGKPSVDSDCLGLMASQADDEWEQAAEQLKEMSLVRPPCDDDDDDVHFVLDLTIALCTPHSRRKKKQRRLPRRQLRRKLTTRHPCLCR